MSEFEIWTEKFRPSNLDEIIGQKPIVEKLKAFVTAKNMPHLLFAGPAGTGKTTCAIAMARELYAEDWKKCMLELNASDERGIDIIRVKVKDFARTKPMPGIPFKIIMLDEADSLTKDAQHALRRTMESYTNTCRFILSCNYSSKIILPIQSRCAVFRFKPLAKEEVLEYVNKIAESEKLKIDDKALNAVYDASEGDLRRATNILQSAAALAAKIDEAIIYSVSGVAKPKEIENVIKTALAGDIKKAKTEMFNIMLNYGLSGIDAVKLINKQVWDSDIPSSQKIWLIDKIGEYEFRIIEGADEFLQIEALLAQFAISKEVK
ncbi:MAG: replication factor C small subunit [Candidatus Nanoarchaeia archaeon]